MSSVADLRIDVDRSVPTVSVDSLWRETYAQWLDHHQQYPLRFVVAPTGSGKTTATALWARRRARRTAWIALPPVCSAETLWTALAERLGNGGIFRRPTSDASEIVDVVVDDIENAQPDARALLADIYRFAVDGIRFIYLARSAEAIDVRDGSSVGLVAYAEPSLLRLDAAEIALLSAAVGVPFTMTDCDRLCRATGGWAPAAVGAVWAAARDAATLDNAYARWRRKHDDVVDALVERALSVVGDDERRLFTALLSGSESAAPQKLRRLERSGLFVESVDGALELNPVVFPAHVRSALVSTSRNIVEPAVIEMFGRFRMIAGGREVRFARRRDAQIVQYLALRHDGCATRATLLEVFWPNVERQLAAQSLRTACSAIRRALSECVGRDTVECYFSCDSESLRLHFDSVVSSAYRFRAHANLAVIAAQRCEDANVHAHCIAALRLYTAPLLCGEPTAPWIENESTELAFTAGFLQELCEAAAPVGVGDASSRIA